MVSTLATTVLFVIVYGIAGLSGGFAQEGKKMNPASLQYGLELLKDQSQEQFTGIELDKIVLGIRLQVDNNLARTLTLEAQPQKDPQVKAGIFFAKEPSQSDLVEYRWTFNGVQLRMVQSLNALKLEIPLAASWRLEDVKALVGSIVKLKGTDRYDRKYEVHLRWPEKLTDGVQFSSNPSLSLRFIITWPDRVDAFVENGRLNILIYKKIDQLAGYQDGSRWFEQYPPSKK